MVGRYSLIWEHFRETSTRKQSQCNHCGRIITIRAGSIGNMWRHLKRLHPDINPTKEVPLMHLETTSDTSDQQTEHQLDPDCSESTSNRQVQNLDRSNFIDSVRKNPCLWKMGTADYKNMLLRAIAWESVAEENSLSVDLARLEWRRLRHSFRVIKQNKDSTSAPWEYEEQMDFLLPYLTPKKRNDERMNFLLPYLKPKKQNAKVNIEPAETTDNIEEDPLSENVINSDDNYNPTKENIKERNIYVIVPDSSKKKMKTNQHVNLHEASALEKFFSSMHDTTAKLPDDIQLRVQRQVFNVVMEAKEEDINRKKSMKDKNESDIE